MKLLNLLSFVFLIVAGSAGRVQDTREEAKEIKIAHLEKHVKSLQRDSIKHAKPVVVTIERVRDSVIVEKKTVKVPVLISLTGEESLRIGRIEFPIVQKEKLDSYKEELKKRNVEINARPGIK